MGVTEVEAADGQVRDRGDAVGAVGQVRAVGAVEVAHRQAEDLTEAERDDGQVVTGHTQVGAPMMRPRVAETEAPTRTTTKKGGFHPIVANVDVESAAPT